MPFQIVRNDITKMKVDAIVNAANPTLLGGGGVDGCIHRAAGPELLAECRTLGGCKTGEAKLTAGYRLPSKYVIHTVGPVWQGGTAREPELLASCYRESLRIAQERGCETVAFPLISSGVYGYPRREAFAVAADVITGFLRNSDMTVYLVIFDRPSFVIGEELFPEIAAYVDDRYVDAHTDAEGERRRRMLCSETLCGVPDNGEMPCMMAQPSAATFGDSLDERLGRIDESFSEMLLRKIDERRMTDAECYKKANIDRKLFSKIRGDVHYRPSKTTAIAFAVALELPRSEADDLLRKAGFALSHSNKFDIIIEYFIDHGIYDVFQINEALFAFDQSLLGA